MEFQLWFSFVVITKADISWKRVLVHQSFFFFCSSTFMNNFCFFISCYAPILSIQMYIPSHLNYPNEELIKTDRLRLLLIDILRHT